MTYRGHIKNGQVALDDPAHLLPEGAAVQIEVVDEKSRITSPVNPQPLRKIRPLRMPGGSLADELIRDRR
jgi:hypothetical protein